MTDLASLQKAMARTVLGQEAESGLLDAVRADGLSAAERLRIHQNNYRESLGAALLGIFPICEAFVGEVFLKQALRHFVVAHPPKEAALYAYGAGVPDFLRNYKAAESVPYLGGLAHLEWLTHELATAVEAPVFDDLGCAKEALAHGHFLKLHDNARLLAAAYPVYDLWQVATGQLAPEDVSIDGGTQTVLLVLHEGQVFYQLLGDETATYLAALCHEKRVAAPSDELLEELVDRGAIALA